MRSLPLSFPSADGRTARLQLPGGLIQPGGWEKLATLADLGGGRLHATSRGNLQVRGITDPAEFHARATDAGFSAGPSIIASPLSRLTPLVDALRARLAGTAASPRLLLGIDDGGGDILAEAPDLGLQLTEHGTRLIKAGYLTGEAATTGEVLAEIARLAPGCSPAPASAVAGTNQAIPPVGWLPAGDGSVTLGAGLRFGILDVQVARMLDVIGVECALTPWRSVVVHDLSESVAEQVVRVLAPLGLLFDANSPWLRISACVGSPACGRSLSDTRADATRAADTGMPDRLHFAGCARNCGRPRQTHTLYQATGDGEYEVLGPEGN